MVSIVVPSYNRNESLKTCLKSIRDNSHFAGNEILVPHPEEDGELEDICRFHGATPYLDGSRVGGVRVRSLWAIINEGIQRASFKYVSWLNDDCSVLPDWDLAHEECFRPRVGLVVLKARGINGSEDYRTIEAAFGIPCANYGIMDKSYGVRFDESFSWFYGDADIGLQFALDRKLGIAVSPRPCVDHKYLQDETRAKNEKDPRAYADESRFKVKWRTYSQFGTKVIDFRSPLVARLARKVNRMVLVRGA